MKCPMCNSEMIHRYKENPYKIRTPQGLEQSVCGRCYMLVKAVDVLNEIKEAIKDGGLRIARKGINN